MVKKTALLNTATEVLVKNSSASMHDIAAASGIARSTLHRYYASREELIQALVLTAFAEVEQALDACHLEERSALDALERVVRALMPIGHRYHFLLDEGRSVGGEELDVRGERLIAALNAVIQRGQEAGELRRDLPVRWINDSLAALLFTAWENIRDGYIAPLDAPQLVMTTLLAGVGTKL